MTTIPTIPTITPPSIPAASELPLTTLARFSDRHATLDALGEAVEPLRDAALDPAVGEAELHKELKGKLGQAFDLLSRVNAANVGRLGAQLDVLLDDVAWDAARELVEPLKARAARQEEELRRMRVDWREWETRVSWAAGEIEGARREGAPFADLDRDLKAAQSQMTAMRRAFEERSFFELPALRLSARTAVEALVRAVRSSEAKVARIKQLVKHADLLIMQVAASADEYEYRVLLRSADRLETRGINIIQDVRRLSKSDRDWLVSMLAKVTESVNAGFRAAHAARAAAGGATPAVAPPAPERDALQQLAVLGEFMFRMIIPDEMQRRLREERWSFSITTNDLELPWELASFSTEKAEGDVQTYLCLERCVSRMPLGGIFPTGTAPVAGSRTGGPRRRRMLLVHSDPDGNLPAAEEEVNRIAEALEGAVDFVRVRPAEATNAHLNDVLMGPPFDFIHYAGHAHFDKLRPQLSGLQLRDAVLTADKIRRLNKGGALIFLNACESGTVARADDAPTVSYLLTAPEPVVGLASAFVYSGALGCVGSLWPVYDEPAAQIAVRFYQEVLAGEPTGEALRKAREHVRASFPREITWAAYVLYGDPTFRLTES